MADKTKTRSLDSTIASALSANGAASRDMLALLVSKAIAAIGEAQLVIDAETPKLHNIENDDPDATRQLIESNKLRVERLTLSCSTSAVAHRPYRFGSSANRMDRTSQRTSGRSRPAVGRAERNI